MLSVKAAASSRRKRRYLASYLLERTTENIQCFAINMKNFEHQKLPQTKM